MAAVGRLCIECGVPCPVNSRVRRGLCVNCYERHRYHKTLIDFERVLHSREEVIEDVTLLLGNPPDVIVQRLKYNSRNSLRRTLKRAERQDLWDQVIAQGS